MDAAGAGLSAVARAPPRRPAPGQPRPEARHIGSEREQATLEAAIRKHMEKARHLVTAQAGACSAYGTDVHQHLQSLTCPEAGSVTVKGVVVRYKLRMTDHEPAWHTAPLVRCGDHALVVDTTIHPFDGPAVVSAPGQ